MQRFKRKKNSQLHFANCRAEKPTPTELTESKNEEESDSESSSHPTKRRYGGCQTLAARQKSNSTNIVLKNCSIVIKRSQEIEKAIKMGFSSLTYIGMNWKKGSKWVVTDLIGVRPGRKTT